MLLVNARPRVFASSPAPPPGGGGGPAVVDDFETVSFKAQWVGDEIVNTSAGGDTITFNSAFRNIWWNAAFGPDTNVAVDVPAQAGGTSAWLFARSDGNNKSSANGWGNHYGCAYAIDGSEISIWKAVAGTIGSPLFNSLAGFPDMTGAGGNVWFRVTGAGPVLLEVLANGNVVASYTDTSGLITSAGYTGIGATASGTVLDNFAVSGSIAGGGGGTGGGGGGGAGGGPNPAVVDDFERSSLGTNWVGPDVAGGYATISSNLLLISNFFRFANYNVSLGSPNQIGAVTFIPDGSSNTIRLMLRMVNPLSAYNAIGEYYAFYVKQDGSEVGIYRATGTSLGSPPVFTVLDTETVGIPSLGSSAVLRALAGDAGALQLWVNDTKLIDITDGTPIAAGNYSGLSSQGQGIFNNFAVAAA